MVIKIGIIGSCATRDIFRSVYNSDYFENFEIVFDIERVSIISLTQPPVNYCLNDIKIFPENRSNEVRTKRLEDDLSKNFFQDIKKGIDILLIDLYFEIKFGIMIYDNNILTNNTWDYPETVFYKKMKPEIINMQENPQTYMKIFSDNFDKLYNFIKSRYPNVRIVLNSIRTTDKIKNKKGEIVINEKLKKSFSGINNNLTKLENYIKNNYDIEYLNFEESILDENHIWGPGEVHYESAYYQKTYKKMLNL